MALFVTPEGKRKSPIVMTCFFVSLMYMGVFGALYALLTEPLALHVQFGHNTVTTTVHCMVIALLGTTVCCLLFLLRDKRIVPYSFIGLAVILLAFYAAAFQLDPAVRGTMLAVVSLYGLMPVVVSNLISWMVYYRLHRAKGGPL